MADTAILVEEIGKRFHIGQKAPHLRLSSWLRSRGSTSGQTADEDGSSLSHIWALKDVSFEVHRAEAIGVIGENGAGKSTLLKIMAKILEPTEGRVAIRGRVRSLLEVGTGFHPELTGRENVYLSGTILGMRREEIKRKFDEIVQFASVERFIDTPVKHYSSGMFVRLGFAVAVMLEPEVLLLDEVIAVGDVHFQKRCLDRLSTVTQNGCTVLFVSHNLGAVADLCSRAVLLSGGRMAGEGTPGEMITRLIGGEASTSFRDLTQRDGSAHDASQLLSVETNNSAVRASTFSYNEAITVRIGVRHQVGATIHLAVIVRDPMGHRILCLHSRDKHERLQMGGEQSFFDVNFRNILNSGVYHLTVWLWDEQLNRLDWAPDCLQITSDTSLLGTVLCNTAVYIDSDWSSVKPS